MVSSSFPKFSSYPKESQKLLTHCGQPEMKDNQSLPALSSGTFCNDGNISLSALSSIVAISHAWILSTWNVLSATEAQNLYWNVINFNLNSHIWLIAIIVDKHRILDSPFPTLRPQDVFDLHFTLLPKPVIYTFSIPLSVFPQCFWPSPLMMLT